MNEEEQIKREAEELYKDWYAHKLGAISIIDVMCKMAEPREKRIAELEMTISKMEKGTCDICKETEKDKKIADLEKENVELKEKNNRLNDKIVDLGCKVSEANSNAVIWTEELVAENKYLAKQLTKAKELLKQWLQTSKASGCDNINIVTDTEQFLKDSEVKELEKSSDKWKNLYNSTNEQLTEAKEIIKDLLNLPFASNEEVFADVSSHLDRAEQFLKE